MAEFDLSEMLKTLGSDPELMKKAASMLGAAGKAPEPAVPSKLPTSLPGGDERGRNLLKALRPYMSGRRREMIDYMLSFESIGDFMKILGQNGGRGNV